jgi:hypothetical protein
MTGARIEVMMEASVIASSVASVKGCCGKMSREGGSSIDYGAPSSYGAGNSVIGSSLAMV